MVATATLAVVLVLSGSLKVRQPQAVDRAFSDLQVPTALQAAWIRRSFPWLEILLGVLLLVLSGTWLILAAAVNVAVFCAYLVLISRAAASPETVECNCFGVAGRAPVTRRTVVRNIGLLVTAAVVLAGTLTQVPSWTAAVSSNPAVLAGCVPAVGVLALLWNDHMASVQNVAPGAPQTPTAGASPTSIDPFEPYGAPGHGEDDYIREPIPRYALRQGSGNNAGLVTLRQLVASGPVLLVRTNPGCGSCETLITAWQQYQQRLGTTVRMLPVFLSGAVPVRDIGELDPQQYLYDENLALDALFEIGGTPWGVLLGADGRLAGGPELGVRGIEQMVTEIQEVLQEIPDHQTEAQI